MKRIIPNLALAAAALVLPTAAHVAAADPRSPDEGLVAYWSFDEGSGTTAYDYSGYGNHGAVFGPTWSGGVSGTALSCDGQDDYVNCGNGPSLNLGESDFSLLAWVKVSKTGAQQQVVRKGRDIASSEGRWVLSVSETNQVRIVLEDENQVLVCVGGCTITDAQWHHICAVFDRDDELMIFVNGDRDSSFAISAVAGSVSSSRDCFMAASDGHAQSFLGGIIDEVRIYNRALSAEEVRQLYEADAVLFNARASQEADASKLVEITYRLGDKASAGTEAEATPGTGPVEGGRQE